MAELWTNNAESTLDGAISNSVLSLAVQAGHGARFPSPSNGDYCWATIEDEIVKVTARSTDTLTIVRAQQGTAAAAHANGVPVKLLWTAESARYAAFNHMPGRISGRRYVGSHYGNSSNGGLTLDRLYGLPFYVGSAAAFDGILVASTGVASAFTRLGIYEDAGGKPGALIVDAGQVDCASTGEKIASISATLSGLVWVAGVGQGVAPSLVRVSAGWGPVAGTTSGYSAGAIVGFYQGSVSGALPAPWGATLDPLSSWMFPPVIYLRTA